VSEYNELALDNQLCFALYNASRAMTKTYQPHLKKLGLTYPQYIAMLSLWQQDGCSVKALGESLMLDSGTLTPLLKRLEVAGLVNRNRSLEDERTVLVTLTQQGKSLKMKAIDMRQKMMCNHQGDIEKLVKLKQDLQELTQTLLME